MSKVLAYLTILLGVAYITLLSRKLLGLTAERIRVNKVGLAGLLQPLLDAFKLLSKELLVTSKAGTIVFGLVVVLTLYPKPHLTLVSTDCIKLSLGLDFGFSLFAHCADGFERWPIMVVCLTE